MENHRWISGLLLDRGVKYQLIMMLFLSQILILDSIMFILDTNTTFAFKRITNNNCTDSLNNK